MKELILAFDGEPRAKTSLDDQNRTLIATRGDFQLELSLKDGSVTADLSHKDVARCGHCYSPKMRIGSVLLCPNMEDSPMHGFNPGRTFCGISFDNMLAKYNLTREDYREARKEFYEEVKTIE